MIRVIYRDGTEDQVTQKFLDILLYVGEVQMFQRENDWVVVGADSLRVESRTVFSGDDRRLHQHTKLEPLQMCG